MRFFIVMTLFSILVSACIFLRAILRLRWKWHWKALLALPVLAAAFRFQMLWLFGGSPFASGLPAWFLLGTAWMFACALMYAVFLLLADVVEMTVRLILRIRKKPFPESWTHRRNQVNLCLLVLCACLITAGVFQAVQVPSVREIPVTLRGLPERTAPLRIVLLADLHADNITRADRIRAIVEKANSLNPDLTVIAGDFVDGSVADMHQELLPLKDLKAGLGVYAVPGNHEYYSGYGEWMDYLSSLGIRMLLNESVLLDNGAFALAGVTDPAAGQLGLPESLRPDIDRALSGVPVHEIPVILLAHQPKLAPEAAEKGVDLQLSGHTHGGMVRGLDLLVARSNKGFVSGFYQVGPMALYVSNGSGIWNGFPVRLGRPSEITLLTCTPEAE